MKIYIYNLFLHTLLVVLFSGCRQNKSPESNPILNDTTSLSVSDSQSLYHINLNAGKKWTVDKNMMVYIRSIEKQIMLTQSSDSAGISYTASVVNKNISLLTSHCTMEGDAHDELHKWLLPFIEMADSITPSSNNKRAEILDRMKYSFMEFNRFFE